MKRLGVIGYGGRIRGMLKTIDKFGTDATVVGALVSIDSYRFRAGAHCTR